VIDLDRRCGADTATLEQLQFGEPRLDEETAVAMLKPGVMSHHRMTLALECCSPLADRVDRHQIGQNRSKYPGQIDANNFGIASVRAGAYLRSACCSRFRMVFGGGLSTARAGAEFTALESHVTLCTV
jgi:hypothetical protein